MEGVNEWRARHGTSSASVLSKLEEKWFASSREVNNCLHCRPSLGCSRCCKMSRANTAPIILQTKACGNRAMQGKQRIFDHTIVVIRCGATPRIKNEDVLRSARCNLLARWKEFLEHGSHVGLSFRRIESIVQRKCQNSIGRKDFAARQSTLRSVVTYVEVLTYTL